MVDEVYELESYPSEDSKVRAESHTPSPGGNAANVAFMLKKLWGSQAEVRICSYVGDDLLGDYLVGECCGRHISTASLVRLPQHKTSKTVVLRTAPNRTCIHLKACPDVDLEMFKQGFCSSIPSSNRVWVHFEGRNTLETLEMMKLVRTSSPENVISLELERCRLGNEYKLLEQSPLVCVFSQTYLQHFGFGFDTVKQFFTEILLAREQLGPRTGLGLWVVTFGSRGSVSCLVSRTALASELAVVVEPTPLRVIDSLGAGDCFMAGLIYHVSQHGLGSHPTAAVQFATQVAVHKLQRLGI
ncbi:hypothetical protein BASA81_012342 [Batrachochytrium salamandrivorans]|nr:hypothetical protein BASA81_012342 [Batrachochytrium salamandrivorans]